MTNVLEFVNENKIIIGVIVLIFIATIYMGISERRLDNINNDPTVVAMR